MFHGRNKTTDIEQQLKTLMALLTEMKAEKEGIKTEMPEKNN